MARGKDAQGKARLTEVSVADMGLLQVAARLGRLDVDVLKCMVEELGFDINAGSKDCGVTAFIFAAFDGKLDSVRYLLDNGADPNKKDVAGCVPPHCAAKNGHDELAAFLLSRGASVDIACFNGTPLHIAAAYGKPSVMRVLLEHGADVLFRGTHWCRQWAVLQKLDEEADEMKTACRHLETTIMHFFGSHGWMFINRIAF